MEIRTYLREQKEIVERALADYMLEACGPFAEHISTLRYSLFAGGKRIRPILCLTAARMTAGPELTDQDVLPTACALECIHTYSLIHDDLPAMDDDALRRGKPTNHAVYGEAAAILAGDALQCFAFELMSNEEICALPASTRLKIITTIARAAGPEGMVGGQFLDVMHEGRDVPYDLLRTIHAGKTGALITASVVAGAIAAGADDSRIRTLARYGDNAGLAFQIADDILNVESTSEQLGKAAGSDAARGKATYPALFGLEESRRMAREAARNAQIALEDFGDRGAPLRAIADYIVTRTR